MSDSLQIDTLQIAQWRSDQHFDYDRELYGGDEKLWDWIIAQMGRLFNDLFDTVIDNAATRWLLISAGAILLFFVLFLLWKYQPGLFGRNKKLSPLDYEVSEDTIYGIDFDREIGQAERRGDYRQAVRMVYLQTLAALSESHKLDWQPQKTPSEYIREVRSNSFTQMSNSFIRVRYGNFEATRELLEQMRQWQRQQTEGGGHE